MTVNTRASETSSNDNYYLNDFRLWLKDNKSTAIERLDALKNMKQEVERLRVCNCLIFPNYEHQID